MGGRDRNCRLPEASQEEVEAAIDDLEDDDELVIGS